MNAVTQVMRECCHLARNRISVPRRVAKSAESARTRDETRNRILRTTISGTPERRGAPHAAIRPDVCLGRCSWRRWRPWPPRRRPPRPPPSRKTLPLESHLRRPHRLAAGIGPRRVRGDVPPGAGHRGGLRGQPTLVVEADIDAGTPARCRPRSWRRACTRRSSPSGQPPAAPLRQGGKEPPAPGHPAVHRRPDAPLATGPDRHQPPDAATGLKPENGIDLHFLKQARGRKEILELESADFQIRLLSGFSDELQRLFLEQTLDDPLSTRAEVEKMLPVSGAPGHRRDREPAFRRAAEGTRAGTRLREALRRAQRPMAEKIKGYLRAGKDCLVVVGAGHLVGETGILKRLSERGITAGTTVDRKLRIADWTRLLTSRVPN